MNVHFLLGFRGLTRQIVYRLGIAGLAVAFVASPAAAQSPSGVALHRIVSEIRELRRLIFLLKQDERKARTERTQVAKYRNDALQYANGGRHVLHLAGFVALVQKVEQSPAQASLWQAYVPVLEADNFVPTPKQPFAGGDTSQLVHYCRTKHLGVRVGGRAQLIIANLVCDAVRQADAHIAELDERIEHYKAQNIAHTDLVGKLLLYAQHCHGCHGCYHYGYGYCGSVPALNLDHPIAGLNSRAYETKGAPGTPRPSSSGGIVTDHRRLKFLTLDEPTPATQPADNQMAETKDRTEFRKSDELPLK